VFDAFERTQAASIVGATARLAASGRTLQPDAIEPALWQNLLSARLIHQNADGQWLFEPAIASLLVQLDEEEPLLGARILWVDDKPENNEREGARLQGWGAEVMHALDTDSALDTLRTRFIDIVISDMVRGTHYAAGLDLLQRMRATNRHMPFIVYAAAFAERSPHVALNAGAFGCTNDREELYALIKAALRHQSEPVAAPASVPSLMHKVLVSAGLAAIRIDELLAKHPGNPVEIARELLSVGSSASACYTNHLRLIEAFAGSTVNQLIISADEGLVVSAQVLADGIDARFSIASRDGLIGESAQSGQVVWASNVSLATRYIAAEPTTRSELVMPVFDQRRGSRVAAVVNVELPRTHALTGDQVEWLKAFVAPLNSYLPTHEPRTIIVFNERDRTSASNLASELSQAGRRAELLHPPEGTNIHDALLLLASHASLTTPPTARVKCTAGRIVVCLDKPSAPLDPEDWPRVIALYADHAEGLSQLVELLAPEGGPPAVAYRPQAATKAKATASSLQLEIHYATDREPEPRSSGNLVYGSGRAERLSYGVCEVSVPPNHHLGALERPSALRLQFRPNPAQHFMQLSNRPVTYSDFASALLPPLSAAKPGLLLYVPGFNLDFEHSVLLAAQIKMDLVTETVLYSWPSAGKVTGFLTDQTTAAWAVSNLSSLLRRLGTVSSKPFHVWADGLGAHILIAALADLRRGTPRFGQIILTRPTVDLAHFERTATLLAGHAERATVYLASNDLLSSTVASLQGRPRGGAQIDTVPGVDIIDVSDTQASLGSLGANAAVLADIHAVLSQGSGPEHRPGLRRSPTASGAHWSLGDAAPSATPQPDDTSPRRPRIFISYVHRYARYAQAVVDALGNRAEVAWDKQLKAGDNFAEELARMLEQADAVVAVVGSLTVTSLFASHEIQRSLELGKRLIPVVVDKFKEPADLHKLTYANPNATGGPVLLSEVAPEELEQVARTTADSILRAVSGGA
jgi:esterase/lipase superfamily enzyme/CheY-like chemotaxis protein